MSVSKEQRNSRTRVRLSVDPMTPSIPLAVPSFHNSGFSQDRQSRSDYLDPPVAVHDCTFHSAAV